MPDDFHTVDEAARILRVHPKTILRFIRDGKLNASRVGKAYRIRRADLAALAGEAPEPAPVRVTTAVDVPDASPALHQYVARSLQAVLNSRTQRDSAVHLEAILDPELGRIKIVIIASLGDTAALLQTLDTLLQSFRG
ncbi:helix-turn-helix domain-containing protein [Burkholderia stagnalis]|uniref:helix-turn-helix domain-containing protein n=1 Tax=Burkholderia stagnalis TaxID=1503054 RepID=UPI000F56304E|nr:helix-turn-helix domain-containing protein [Burkholderia stagnalis]RQQ26758.1 DNA-binding protein [Burkholderia stagnalis]RQQ29955.1 DNA-binding protein [Burkholderia stagnalis]RQQ46750.1 DNA-binding protein [Burkholderia stagnalis]RQX96543.1 DNA-binding protein [Burkholderia stagnalis]RQY10074.1 DNA-binding protein [Burkholderia stagnalis]